MARLKNRLYQWLDGAHDDTPGRIIDGLIFLLIIGNVMAVTLQSVPEVYQLATDGFRRFEAISIGFFVFEYALRVWTATADKEFRRPIVGRLRFVLTPLMLIDLAAILPYFITIAGVDLRILRAARILRIFRILRLSHYAHALHTFGRIIRKNQEQLISIVFILGVLILIGGTLVYFVEHPVQPKKFGTIPDAMWWAVATVTTVGYGDIVPVTPIGKLLGAFIAISGIGMFALPTGLLGASFVSEIRAKKQNPRCKHCGKPT